MTWNRRGVTREVFLVGQWAIKVPRMCYGWRSFLQGLLANLQEVDFWSTRWPTLCPVLFAIPGGWLVVMRRARPLTDQEWAAFDYPSFVTMGCHYAAANLEMQHGNPRPGAEPEGGMVPVENKQDSFGVLNGVIVAVDYGN